MKTEKTKARLKKMTKTICSSQEPNVLDLPYPFH